MSLGAPDPINVEGDNLYAIYRKGIIKRHISKNGLFLNVIALERINPGEINRIFDGDFLSIRHSAPGAERGPNVEIKIPLSCVRYSEEIDPDGPVVDGKYPDTADG